ncbi:MULTISPECIES: MarR family transcriptional regulator [unclassified Arthrobacter]|uniref:MarR family winged helix-turn-helix transcriptional regulator n=1 Tax=unclassified Arthrobacter TaxID=235627 RepID=UPI001E2B5A47|nr:MULTISPECIES: MarR family transcriptional regulator [unclassified Arthrobacter]MCC9144515.1 MarR family transcriptional regulator [Arthrobacter sp. zg-Y919]MDK1275741.1 MarR family transcriptional regulator [Arthrobacter sp. zg.Y919]WIB02893.1 MarR family transcriptional regulator [Arthrobacter sp. zg-Y919]
MRPGGAGGTDGGGTDDGGRRRPPRLIFLTLTAERRLRRWIGRRGEDRGLSAPAAGVLLYLATRPGASTGEVAEAVDASPAGLSGLLSRLEKAGLLTRAADPADRRTIRVNLTAEGKSALGVVQSALGELNGKITDGFSAQELAVVARWLRHVAEVLD